MTKFSDEQFREVARILGMKRSEVVDLRQASGGVLAQTHDGNWTLVRDDGSWQFRGKDPDRLVAEEPEAGAAEKPAPKGRSQA